MKKYRNKLAFTISTNQWKWIIIQVYPHLSGASQAAQWVKNPPTMQKTNDTQVQSLGPEDSLGEEMTTHSIIHAWRILWTEEPGGLQSIGWQKVRQDWSG